MYAAAGGASLASRQARQRQRQQNNKNKVLLQQGIKDKLAASKLALATPRATQQSRQFHNLPPTYLRTPQAQARKLSAGYTTTQSKLLLPISEGSQNETAGRDSGYCPVHSKHERHHPHGHHHHHHPHHLHKSATATLPFTSQITDSTPPTTPTTSQCTHHHTCNQLPVPSDSIIVTPATPNASPGPHGAAASAAAMERKCSFYRDRKRNNHVYEDYSKPPTVVTTGDEVNQDEYHTAMGMPNGGNGSSHTGAHKYADSDYCDSEHRHMEVCTCDRIECAQGRAAWLERGRRCSVQENGASCHRRWVKRNRVHDSSLGGSSDDEDFLGVLRGPSSFANAFLYVGLGTVAIGLVIAFVGTGEKGFKTGELRLIGPSLIGIGLMCCILRIFFCICPSHCLSSSRRKRSKKTAKIDADHTTSLLRGDSKRVSIARGPATQAHKSRSNHSKMNEGMEALRQIATTSLFLQNEQKLSSNRIVPIIKEPEKSKEEVPLEMKKLDDQNIDICSISDDDAEDDYCADTALTQRGTVMQMSESNPSNITNNSGSSSASSQRPNKLLRQRASVNQTKSKDSDTNLMETSLMILNPPSSSQHPLSQYTELASGSSNIFESTKPLSPPKSQPSPAAAQQHDHHPFSLAAASEASSHSQTMQSQTLRLSLPPQQQQQQQHQQHSQPVIQPSVHQHLSSVASTSSSKPIVYVPSAASQLSPPPMSSLSSHWQPQSSLLLPSPPAVHQQSLLMPPPSQSSEPELVLSPAKLGQ